MGSLEAQTLLELSKFASCFTVSSDHPDLAELVLYAKTYGMKAIISVHDLLFTRRTDPLTNTSPFRLRRDYGDRWQDFADRHREILSYAHVWAFYIADEPFWNGIPRTELETATRIVKASYPTIPTMVSVNTHDLDAAPYDLPVDLLDVVGFHMYAVPQDPNTDPEYQHYVGLLQEKLAGRSYVIVADAWWSPERHAPAGLDVETLRARAHQYREVAENLGAIALGAFTWESFSRGTGLRDQPELLREYIRIGSEITGKCGVPGALDPLDGGTVLFLQDCRFRATVRWRHPATGVINSGIAAPLSRDTGTFWFFEPSNIEVTVKILDGRPSNHHWWVFWSHMTGLDLWLEIVDTATGLAVTYTDSAADTAAFPGP